MKLNRYSLLLIAFCVLSRTTAQSIHIVDSRDKRPLPYATVRSIDYKTGTYSDSNGVVILSNSFQDSIIISSVGYKTKILKRDEVRNDTVYMDRDIRNLPSLTVSPMKYSREVTFGILKAKKSVGWTSGGFGDEFAQKIAFPDSTKKYKIKTVRIGIERIEPDIPVILHIYDLASNGYPRNNLLQSTILLNKENFNKRKKIVELDVSKENIIITDPSCFIGIEWLPVSVHGLQLQGSTALTLTEDSPVQDMCTRAFFYNKDHWTFGFRYKRQDNPFNMLVSVTADEYK
jgi:hypothetical protein